MKSRTAHSIDKLIEQVDVAYPHRAKSSDGTRGDARHRLHRSDHNPDPHGIVHAVDLTHDPKHGFDSYVFADMMRQRHDHRLHMVISNRRIAGDEDFCKGNPHFHAVPWQWSHYDGDSPHDMHVHISVVRDPALADDSSNWDIGETMSAMPEHPAASNEPTLYYGGSEGDAVKELQGLLGIEQDGNFGKGTRDAVRKFQTTHGMPVDGVVGPYTWRALRAAPSPAPAPAPTPPAPDPAPAPIIPVVDPVPQVDIYDAITALAERHPIAKFAWAGRGAAPLGYTKGMACSFASAIMRLNVGDPAVKEMAKANTGSVSRDALAWYSGRFDSLNMSNKTDGIDTLRHLFVLMLGLGMRETSGTYCDGRDASANNMTGTTAEAGMFQMSWNASISHPEIRRLLTRFTGDGFLAVYREGVRCSPKQLRNFGTGPGLDYQKMAKTKPDFAVLCAGVGLRNIRTHWGPINRHEAQVVTQADAMFRQVQQLVAMQGGGLVA